MRFNLVCLYPEVENPRLEKAVETEVENPRLEKAVVRYICRIDPEVENPRLEKAVVFQTECPSQGPLAAGHSGGSVTAWNDLIFANPNWYFSALQFYRALSIQIENNVLTADRFGPEWANSVTTPFLEFSTGADDGGSDT